MSASTKKQSCIETPQCANNEAGLQNLRVSMRKANCSAFNGYRVTTSDYSQIICIKCGAVFRSKAAYIDGLKSLDINELETSEE